MAMNKKKTIHESVEMIAKKRIILKNGLISDHNFYMKKLFYISEKGKKQERHYTVGKYERKPITSLRGTTEMFSGDYQTLSPALYLLKWRGNGCK